MTPILKKIGLLLIVLIFAYLSLLFRLDVAPQPWFDEGWVLAIAKNLAELGHYGRLLNGMPIPESMINIGVSTIGPISIIFKLFGVGIAQGRIMSVICTIGSLVSLYYLSKILYNQIIAIASVLISIFFTIGWTNPIFIGRQALGEMPALFFLLVGFLFLSISWDYYLLGVLGATIFWGLSILSKSQVLPFLIVSLLLPTIFCILKRDTKNLKPYITSLLTLMLVTISFRKWLPLLNPNLDAVTQKELFNSTIFVPILSVRIAIVLGLFIYSIPLIAGTIFESTQWIKKYNNHNVILNIDLLKLSFITFVGSWLIWYALFSIGWPRYMFIPTFIGSIFVAKMLNGFTREFDIKSTIENGNNLLRHFKLRKENLSAIFSIILISFYVPLSINTFFRHTISNPDRSFWSVVEFLNNETSRDAIIETYEMELFPFIDRNYHFPPDYIQLQLNRRSFMGQNVQIEYNPLDADPEYLVVGAMSKGWELYDDVLETGEFQLLKSFNEYDIYKRDRN